MSQENVDAMRKVYEAMARGDFWAAGEVLDPEIEWSWPSTMSGLTGVKTYHGIEGVEAATRDVFKAWEMFRQEAEEFIEEGDDVVVVVRMYGRLKGSSQEIEETSGHVWTFRDARVIRFRAFDTPTQALEAAGLSE
jgi:ketosteroid isomerase-like protein